MKESITITISAEQRVNLEQYMLQDTEEKKIEDRDARFEILEKVKFSREERKKYAKTVPGGIIFDQEAIEKAPDSELLLNGLEQDELERLLTRPMKFANEVWARPLLKTLRTAQIEARERKSAE